jgi:hypothetical protein
VSQFPEESPVIIEGIKEKSLFVFIIIITHMEAIQVVSKIRRAVDLKRSKIPVLI